MEMNITSFQLGPIGTNCYLIEKSGAVLVVDPGGDAGVILDYCKKNQITPTAIVLTHAHFDHIGAVEQLLKSFDMNVYLHEAEHDWLTDPDKNGSARMMNDAIVVNASPLSLKEGSAEIGDFSFRVLHTPGHSPGGISLVFDECVVAGDTLFQRGIGRTDLYGGDVAELEKSIRKKLYSLPDHFIVYPGHGGPTTIGTEKNSNPFFRR